MALIDRARWRAQPLRVVASPLRRTDPRARLFLSMCASLAVMIPLDRMLIFMGLYALLLVWARLLPVAWRQIWRLRWLLIALFAFDWVFVGLDLAVTVSLRIVLLSSVFALFVSTTTPEELRLALERLGVPYRYAFSLSLAFLSVDLLRGEWHAIREAQMARGAWAPLRRLRDLAPRELIALTVPAIVLATRRAWALTEAVAARGFDAPHRRPYLELKLGAVDWVAMGVALVVVGLLLFL